MSETVEHTFSSTEARELAKVDMDFFGMLAMPEDVTILFPEFYKQLWAILIAALFKVRDFSKFAVGLPRGHGKTFVVKLLVLYCILFTERKFILVVSSIKDNAQNIIADVADMLDSQNIQSVFGNWRFGMEIDRQDQKKFVFNGRPIILKAAGAGTSIRGIQVKNARPDFIICDDVQSRESAESVQESDKLNKWLVATLMKAKAPTGCTTVYVGNMYPDVEIRKGVMCCILRNLQRSKYWISLIVGGILADGKALWEELQPLSQLLEDYNNDVELGCPEIFYAEVLNSPEAGGSTHFHPQKVTPVAPYEGELHAGNFIIIDPSGRKKTSDDTSIGYFEVLGGIPVLRKLISEVLTPKQTIERSIRLAVENGCMCIAVENVAYQDSLIFWFEEALEVAQIDNIEIVCVSNGGRSKVSRILTLFRQWMSQEVGVDQSVFSRALSQATAYNPLKKDNKDDILDIMAYAPEIVLEYPQSITLGSHIDSFEDWAFQREISAPTTHQNSLVY